MDHTAHPPHEHHPNNPQQGSIISNLKEFSSILQGLRESIKKNQNETHSGDFKLSNAHDELDSVVQQMADATHIILDKIESIESIQVHFNEPERSLVMDHIVRMYEACSFQDISGQRIHKVFTILHTIETELEKIFHDYDAVVLVRRQAEEKGESVQQLNYQIIKELYNLRIKIDQMKKEMMSVKQLNTQKFRFSIAKDELDEVSRAAGESTHVILTATESIVALKSALNVSYQGTLDDAATRIYEACAFHDLIGQRVTKVLKGLFVIDQALSKVFDGYHDADQSHQDEDAVILLENGPQLPHKAPTQDIIDAIFKE